MAFVSAVGPTFVAKSNQIKQFVAKSLSDNEDDNENSGTDLCSTIIGRQCMKMTMTKNDNDNAMTKNKDDNDDVRRKK